MRIIFCLLLCSAFISCSNIKKETDIYGTWQGSYNGRDVSFVFNPDKTCELKFADQQTNITETINGNYELDLTKQPVPLSISNIPQLPNPLHTIIEFVNVDSIMIADFSPRWRLRPVSFSKGKFMLLRRVTTLQQ